MKINNWCEYVFDHFELQNLMNSNVFATFKCATVMHYNFQVIVTSSIKSMRWSLQVR